MVVEYPPNCQPIFNTNNTSDLVKRLKALSEALQNSDTNDESRTPDRYRDLAAHLASRLFLDNNSSDVQIWLACCLADIFRIFSPQVPFGDPAQLRDVLIFMTRSLKGLDSPSGPLFRRYFYLLENISVCNTLHLALELPGEEACVIIKFLIKCTMDIVNGKEWAKERESSEELDDDESVDSEKEDKSDRKERMQQLLLAAITKLIGEVDQITIPVLDAMFYYLINPQKSNYRESYNMARSIVQTANASLDVPVENLLTRSLLAGSFLPECEMIGSNRQKLYDVIIELHEAMPSLVVPVIPQVGNFLKDADGEARLAAVKAVGVMVQNPKSRLYEDYPDVWAAYLERRRDKDAKIRSYFAKNAVHILLNNSQLRGPICEAVCRLLQDPDDEVRLDAFHTGFEAARRKLDSVNEDLIKVCCSKMFDAKANIRQEAISKLLQLHNKVIMGEEYTVSDRQVVSVIPVYAFRLYASATDASKEDKVKLERLLSAFIIPYKMETERRIKWMIELHEKLGRVESDVLVNIVLRNAAYRRLTREILFAIKGDAETERKGREIENRIERIAKEQPEPTHFAHVLRKLTNFLTEDAKAFESLYHVVGSDYTCAKVTEAVAAFVGSLSEAKAKFNKEEHTTVRHFVERLAPLILDKDGAEVLAQCVIRADGDFTCQKADGENRLVKCLLLFRNFADAYPHVFSTKQVVERLLKLLRSGNAKTVETTLSVFLFVGSQQKAREMAADWLSDVTTAVWGLVATEQPEFGRVAKLAVRVLCKLEPKAELVGSEGKFIRVAEELEQRLDIEHPACVNALRALSAMQRASPDDFAHMFNEIATTTIVPLILSADVAADDPKTMDLGVEEFSRLKVPKYTYVKVHAMKLLSRSLTGHADVDGLAKKTIKMFSSFIQSNGNVHDEVAEISPVECALMRAVAGSCILRLSYLPKYLKMIATDQFVVLSRLMTDSAECVRRYFSDRLYKGIQRNKLVVEFIALFALPSLLRNGAEGDEVIHKYLEECRTRLKMGILRRAQMIRCCTIPPGNLPFFQPEYSIAYAIFLLATQPILTSHKDGDNLAFLQECIWFLMEAYVQNKTQFDFELMYRSLQEVRQSRSIWAIERGNEGEMTRKEVEELNKKMWALTDLALCMLVYRAKIVIKNEPGETVLMAKFFKKIKETNDPVYAPQELIEAEEKRHGKAPNERKRGMNGTTAMSSKAGKTKTTRAAPSKKKKKVEVIEEDDEEEDEVMESDEEEVMPAPSKRRGLSVRNSDPSTSNGSPSEAKRRSDRNSEANVSGGSPKKTPKKTAPPVDSPKSLKKRTHALMAATTSHDTNGLPEPLGKKTRLSLEDLPFSPIVKDGSMAKKTMHFPKGLVASTPLVKPTGTRSRKLELNDALTEEDEEEVVKEKKKSPAPPTRTRRGSVSEAPKSSPKKKSSARETKPKEKRPSRGTRGRASSPPKEAEEEEIEEKEEPVTRASRRSKKGPEEVEEPAVEKKATRRSGKKEEVVEKKAPVARKNAGKDAKNEKEDTGEEEEEEREEEVKRPARRASARKSNASPAKKKAPARKSAPAEESEKDDEEEKEEEEVEEKKETGKRASRTSAAASKKSSAKKTEEKEDEAEEGEEAEKEEEKKETAKKGKTATAAKKAPAKKNEPKAPASRASRRQGAQPSTSAASPAKSAAASTRSSRRKK